MRVLFFLRNVFEFKAYEDENKKILQNKNKK